MTLKYILNAAGEPEPCDDVIQWAQWYERASQDRSRIVAQDRDESAAPGGVLVSTVFLGFDHQFGSGPPVLWETMILGGPCDGHQERYTSRAAAILGHQAACQMASEAAE